MKFFTSVTVKAIRTSCVTGEKKDVEVQLELEASLGGPVLQMYGGPTGYESYTLDPECVRRSVNAYGEGLWVACMGTAGEIDRLDVPGDEMLRAYRELGVNYADPSDAQDG